MGGFFEKEIKIFFSTMNMTKKDKQQTGIKIGKPVERLKQTNKTAIINGKRFTNRNSFGILAAM
jgi:hypothetical protein